MPQKGKDKKDEENVMYPCGSQDDCQRHIWSINILEGFDQAGQNQHGNDRSHSDVSQTLLGQIFLKRRFLTLTEKAFDDIYGCMQVPLLRDQSPISPNTMVNEMKECKGNEGN